MRLRRKAGSGSSGDVLIPCFFTIARISSEVVGAKEESVEGEEEEKAEVVGGKEVEEGIVDEVKE